MNNELAAMNFKMIDPGVKIQYVPDKQGIEACDQLGKKIAQALPQGEGR